MTSTCLYNERNNSLFAFGFVQDFFFFLVLTPTRTAYWNLRIVGRGCIFKVVVNFFFNHLRYLSFDKKLMILEGSIVLIFFFYIHSERR